MDEVIYKFRKNSREEVRVSIRKFEGRDYLDIRAWVEKESGHGEFTPTRKGLTLSIYVLPELLKGMNALEEELVQRGLLKPQA